MKNIFYTIFLFILSFTAFSQGKWEIQNPKALANTIRDVKRFNSQLIYMCGDRGDFLKSNDGGVTWTYSNLPDKVAAEGMSFISTTTGWVYSADGKVYYTSTAGVNWTLLYNNTEGNTFRSISFSDAMNGSIGGDAGFVDNVFYTTTNGGVNWKKHENLTTITSGFAGIFYVKQFDAQTLYTISWNNLFYATTNAGISWETTFIDIDNVSGYYEDAYFFDKQNGWAIGPNNSIVNTNDFGKTWQRQIGSVDSTDENRNYGTEIFFLTSTTGWASSFGCIYNTTDSGTNWKRTCDVYGTDRKDALQFIDTNNGLCVTGSDIFVTTNSGDSFTNINKNIKNNLASLSIIDANKVVVVGAKGLILKTTNAGQNWVIKPTTTTNNLNDVDFANALVGWCVGNDGTVLKTIDGGESWNTQISVGGILEKLNAVYAISESVVVAVGDANTFLKSTDGGSTWSIKNSITGANLTSISFINSLKGFAVGANGFLAKTTDGGETWSMVTILGLTKNLFNVQFVNSLTGWIVGTSGNVFKTTDGGETWLPQVSGTTRRISNAFFIDENTGIFGGFGFISVTTNGGSNWQEDNTSPSNYFSNVEFYDATLGWVIGNNATIIKYTADPLTTVISNIIDKESISNISIFPNPNNGNIQISNLSENSQKVTFELYNLVGQKMLNVSEKSMNSQIAFELKVSEGLYIYVITTNKERKVGKLEIKH